MTGYSNNLNMASRTLHRWFQVIGVRVKVTPGSRKQWIIFTAEDKKYRLVGSFFFFSIRSKRTSNFDVVFALKIWCHILDVEEQTPKSKNRILIPTSTTRSRAASLPNTPLSAGRGSAIGSHAQVLSSMSSAKNTNTVVQ